MTSVLMPLPPLSLTPASALQTDTALAAISPATLSVATSNPHALFSVTGIHSYATALFSDQKPGGAAMPVNGGGAPGSGSPPSQGGKSLSAIYDSAMAKMSSITNEQERTYFLRSYLFENLSGLGDAEIAQGLDEMMAIAQYDGEAVEVFVIAAFRGIPEAFSKLFALQEHFRDRQCPETWIPPFEEASRRAEKSLCFEIDRQWLYRGARLGDLNSVAMLKRLVLFQDRPPSGGTPNFEETPEQLKATQGLWLAFSQIPQEPDRSCRAIGEIILSSEDPRVRDLALNLLVARTRFGWNHPGTQEAAQTLAALTLQKLPGAFEAVLRSLKRMVPIELADCLRSILRAGLHAEEIADDLFAKAVASYERARQYRPEIASGDLEIKLRQCSPWIGLLEELKAEHPALQRRIHHLHALLKASENGAN